MEMDFIKQFRLFCLDVALYFITVEVPCSLTVICFVTAYNPEGTYDNAAYNADPIPAWDPNSTWDANSSWDDSVSPCIFYGFIYYYMARIVIDIHNKNMTEVYRCL